MFSREIKITVSVLKALFLREALGRMFADRLSGFWLFAEPVAHLAFMAVIFTVIRLHSVAGIDTVVWLTMGMVLFFLFKRTATQAMNGVSASKALFTYRQVKPSDVLLARGALELFVMFVVLMIILFLLAVFGFDVFPSDILLVLSAIFGLWLVGLGFGMIVSVANTLVPEIGQVLELIMMPMYLVSGVIFPLQAIPSPYREWVMLNPVAHGIEGARQGMSSFYHAVPELDLGYLYGWALVLIFFGLALQRHFSAQMVAK